MKPSEFANLDEGLWDTVKGAFAKKGWMGQQAKYAAYTKELEKKQQTVTAAADQARLEKWLTDLPVALAKAVQARLVVLPESAYLNYKYFNNLIESVLSESMSIEDFLKQYMNKLAKSMGIPKLDPSIQTAIDTNINDFISVWRSSFNPTTNPDKQRLSGPAKQAATNLYNTLLSAKELSSSAPGGTVGSGYGAPKTDIDLEIKGVDYHYDAASTTWSSNGTPITEPNDIQILNKAAYDKPKTTPPTPAALPTTDVPDDRASGGLWTPEGAKNSYTFNPGRGIWMMHRPAPAGSPPGSSPMPTQVRDPKMIEKLNKLWAEQGEALE